MEEFANGLEEDLRHLKKNMADHASAADSYFEGVKSQADQLKANIRGSIESLSEDFKVSIISSPSARIYTELNSRKQHHR